MVDDGQHGSPVNRPRPVINERPVRGIDSIDRPDGNRAIDALDALDAVGRAATVGEYTSRPAVFSPDQRYLRPGTPGTKITWEIPPLPTLTVFRQPRSNPDLVSTNTSHSVSPLVRPTP
jgi:hypothetical protein